MNHRSTLFVWALCLSLVSPLAQAVNCARNLTQANNPDSAYTDNGDGTVTHTPTGLIWKRCAEGQTWRSGTCTGVEFADSWGAALVQAATNSFAEKTDWRVPNVKELRSLVEECRSGPTINDTVFPNTPATVFWTSSPSVRNPDSAWQVNFQDGVNQYRSRDLAPASVRLVRGGLSSAAAVLTDSECFFDWAEVLLPTYLRPAKQPTQTVGTLQYREYPDSGVYFGLSGTTIVAIGGQVGTSLLTLGELSTYLPSARAAQCR
ncbi:MAG: DUF1566 domain-containing protein [Burkholderiales bacterium]|nr:DUF1566 domain-containing protein [Burkholderiales bacterium]